MFESTKFFWIMIQNEGNIPYPLESHPPRAEGKMETDMGSTETKNVQSTEKMMKNIEEPTICIIHMYCTYIYI